MSDLVTELREAANEASHIAQKSLGQNRYLAAPVLREIAGRYRRAADEIERLRALVPPILTGGPRHV